MVKLEYGRCPQCNTPRQPPDHPDEDGHEFCFCCDCEIMWYIVHDESTANAETWQKKWGVINVESFADAGWIPYGC